MKTLLILLLAASAAHAEPPKGSPIVFIPGLISHGDVWNETVDRLCADRDCHVLTLPGFAGKEPFEAGPYLPAFKNHIYEYIRSKNLKDVTWVGHSLGGFLGLLAGMDNPDFLGRVVVVDALPFLAGAMNPNATAGTDTAMIRRYIESFAGFEEAQIREARLASARGNTLDSTQWHRIVEWTMASDLVTEANAVGELMGLDLRDRVAEIGVPVLVLAAWAPFPSAPQFTAESVRATFEGQYAKTPDLRVEVTPKSRHFIMFDELEWMVDQIRGFLPERR